MKVSYEWIREYVPTKIRARNLADKLTMAGLEVGTIDEKDGDFVFDIEVIPNRPDWLSHIGIAREVSSITGKALKLPSFEIPPKFITNMKMPPVMVDENTPCPLYTARLIKDVNVGPSPKWLIKKIERMGLRPVNNIVDITNFVLFETGFPLHAFDYDKLSGPAIIVRMAKNGEKITTIDGQERDLKSDIMLIADKEKPVAIAGVMGGIGTEVSSKTKNVLLETACFDAVSIRRAARLLGLSSESSYRFERGVDFTGVVGASNRAASLICEIAKAKASGDIAYIGKRKMPAAIMFLRPQRLNLVLGTLLSADEIKKTIVSLGFKAKKRGKALEVEVPSFRQDISREEDLIEEVARVYGYDNIKTSLPRTIITDEAADFKKRNFVFDNIRNTLTGLSFYEVLTYSLISSEDIKALNLSGANVVGIKNPLSRQQGFLRNTLFLGLLKTIGYNLNQQIEDIKIFELSNIYTRRENALAEDAFVGIAICGDRPSDWRNKPKGVDIFDLEGILITLFDKLGLADIRFEISQHPSLDASQTLAVLSGDSMLGIAGKIESSILEAMDIEKEIYAAEINCQSLIENITPARSFRPILRYPASERDISFSIDEDIPYRTILEAIKNAAGSIVSDIKLVDMYKGKQIEKGKRSLSIRITYQAKEKTLKDAEIQDIDNRIRKALKDTLNAVTR